MYKKILIIITSLFLFINAQDYELNPFIKSALVPGWGERAMKNNTRARFFSNIEISLWTICVGTYTYAYHSKNEYESYAAKYAGVNVKGKNHKYWVDIGNYIDIEEHNAEHLRWRNFDEIYTEKSQWEWESLDRMENFENRRIKSDILFKSGGYVIGAIVLNHILSSIDALYLLRINKIEQISFKPMTSPNMNGVELNIVF